MKIFFLFLFCASFLQAQTYEEFLHQQQKAFSAFKEKRDKEFSDYLNKEWKAYKEVNGEKGYEYDKPEQIPTAPKQQLQNPKDEIVVKKIDKSIKKIKRFKKIFISPVSAKLKTIYLNFFGTDIQIHYNKSIYLERLNHISNKAIKKAWDSLASSKYEVTLKEINDISKKLQLNDWAKYLLIKRFSLALYKDENIARVFTWFSLLKFGYDTRIAYRQNRIVLLLPIDGELYNTVFYRLNGKKYYAIDYYAKGKLGSVVSYDDNYNNAKNDISFELLQLPLFPKKQIHKRLFFKLNKRIQDVELTYNENLMHFFQTYPQVSYSNYFNTKDSALLDESLINSFKPLLLGKSQSKALDIILHFVQNSFAYRVDKEQFNMEKVMFPSETVYYPYSDCEDRAILYTYMVKLLLHLDVVGVKYPNHMSTAVKIQERLKGEYITFKNQAYIVADPTYINANIGMSMPQFVGSNSYEIISTGGEK